MRFNSSAAGGCGDANDDQEQRTQKEDGKVEQALLLRLRAPEVRLDPFAHSSEFVVAVSDQCF